MNETIETVIIGGGQAGLATGYQLKKKGRPFVILDANARLGDQWRRHYDSLTLFTERPFNNLPGLPFPDGPTTYPTRDEVAAYIEAYATHHDLPVRTNTRVERVARHADGTFEVVIGGGTICCDNVVIAVGKAGQPKIPAFAADLDPAIGQLHSSAYQRPSQVPPGRVLVVGAAHSGADIAFELAHTHPVTLVGRATGQVPFGSETLAKRLFGAGVFWVFGHVLTRRTPMGRRAMPKVRAHGGPLLRVRTSDLADRGVERITQRVAGVRDGRPVLDEGTVIDAATVIWATGFGHSFGFIDALPLNADGWPKEYRGVVDGVPGLYFCGLAFQYAFTSMVFPGIGRDSEFVASHLAKRMAGAKRLQSA